MVEALKQHNETLQGFIQFLQTWIPGEKEFSDESLNIQPLSEAVWADEFPENFKTPPFPSFDGKGDPEQHTMEVDNQSHSWSFKHSQVHINDGDFQRRSITLVHESTHGIRLRITQSSLENGSIFSN